METYLILGVIGFIAGIVGSMVGVGGGIVIVPTLVLILGFSQHEAQGTSIATLLFPIGILAALNYHKAGHINWTFAIIMAVTFIAGGYLGSKFAISINQKQLKRVFAVFMFFVAIRMFWSSFK